MSDKPVLYEDNTVRITNDEIQIFQYFFPLPFHKSIKMSDVREANLKTDVTKNKQYLEIVVKGFSINATFSPSDPKKALQIIKARTCYNLAQGGISVSKEEYKYPVSTYTTGLTSGSKGLTGHTTGLTSGSSGTTGLTGHTYGTSGLTTGYTGGLSGHTTGHTYGSTGLTGHYTGPTSGSTGLTGHTTGLSSGSTGLTGHTYGTTGLSSGSTGLTGPSYGTTGLTSESNRPTVTSYNPTPLTTSYTHETTTGPSIERRPPVQTASKSISQPSSQSTSTSQPVTEIGRKAQEAKQNIKQGAKDLKEGAQQKVQQGKEAIKQGAEQVKEESKGIIQGVTGIVAAGWQQVKQVSHNIYETAAEKIHNLTSPETEQKAKEAKQNIKEGAENLKEGARDVKEGAERKWEEGKQEAKRTVGMEPHKSTFQNIKEMASHGLENIVQGAENLMYKVADKVSQVTGTNVETDFPPETKAEFREQKPQLGREGQFGRQRQFGKERQFGRQRPITEQAKQKAEEVVGTDAKEKAQSAKEHFKQGAEDAGESVKKATGYEGSLLQEAKQNFAQGWESTKQATKNVYDTAAQKVSDMGSAVQKKAGQMTTQAGEVLADKGNKMKKNA